MSTSRATRFTDADLSESRDRSGPRLVGLAETVTGVRDRERPVGLRGHLDEVSWCVRSGRAATRTTSSPTLTSGATWATRTCRRSGRWTACGDLRRDRACWRTRARRGRGSGRAGPPGPPGPPPRGAGGGAVNTPAIVALSSTLAMKVAGRLSRPALYDQCNCHTSSSPGEAKSPLNTSGAPPFRVPLFITATRGASAFTSAGDPDRSSPWCDTRYRSTVPIRFVGHIRSNSPFHVRSPRSAVRNLPYVMMKPAESPLSGSIYVLSSLGFTPAQAGFALPPPGRFVRMN